MKEKLIQSSQDTSRSVQNMRETSSRNLDFEDNSPQAIEQRERQELLNQSEIDTSSSPFLPEYENGESPYEERSEELTEQQKQAYIEARAGKATDFKAAYSGDLNSLATALNLVTVDEGLLSDEYLLKILKEAFESNWFKAKACLTTDRWPGVALAPSHEKGILLMKAMVNMRGRMWDKFAKKVQPHIIGEVMRLKNSREDLSSLTNPKNSLDDNFGLKDAVGSESVTSDIDLSAKGENTEIGVAMINREFRTYFGVDVEPGALFDINVYSSDWMFGGEEVREGNTVKITPRSESMDTTGQELSEEAQAQKDEQNEIWSMVKIRRNMTQVDWDIYKQSVLGPLSADAEKTKKMKKTFKQVDAEYLTFHNKVQKEAAKLNKALDYEEQEVSAFANRRGKDHFEEEAIEMAASNRQYEKIILRVKALRLQVKALTDANAPRAEVESLLLEIHNEVSRGLTYANEVYASEGAVLHTVYGKQGAVKKLAKMQKEDASIEAVEYQLTKEQYLQSVNENVGDSLHSLNHNKNNPQYAVYRAGKYMDRLCDAVAQLIGEEEANKIKAYAKVLEIGRHAVEEKKGDAGKDPTAVQHSKSFFSKYDSKKDLDKVKTLTLDLGAKSTGIYKKDK